MESVRSSQDPPITSFSITSSGTNNKRSTVKTRLLILSDTHCAPPYPALAANYAYRHPLPEADVVLHAGDLTERGYQHEYQSAFDFLAAHPAELKLVIAGNHDITLDEEYVRGPHGTRHARHSLEDCRAVKQMWCGSEAKKHGIRYLEEGIHFFALKSGAKFTVYASPYQPVYDSWAFPYERHEDRFNAHSSSDTFPTQSQSSTFPILVPNPLPDAVGPSSWSASSNVTPEKDSNPIPSHPAIDLVLTHGPPLGILDVLGLPPHHNVGCAHLLRAMARCRPLLHVFGHIHEGWGGVAVEWERGRVRDLVAGAGEKGKKGCVSVDLTAGRDRDEVEWGRETAFVNASVMNVEYRPVNAPWVVDVGLPVGEQRA